MKSRFYKETINNWKGKPTELLNPRLLDGVPIHADGVNPVGTVRLNIESYLYSTRVYNSHYNDIAENFPNNNLIYENDISKIVGLNKEGKLELAGIDTPCILGIVSNEYAYLLGKQEDVDNELMIPVSLCGTIDVLVNTTDNVNIGDYIIPFEDGIGEAIRKNEIIHHLGNIVGKVIEIKQRQRVRILVNLI